MKILIKLSVLSILLVGLGSVAQAQTTFKIATIVPEYSSWVVEMRKGAAEIDQRTEGRVKFRFYTGGVQGTDNQVRRKMRIGQLHGGAFTSSGLRHFQPDAELYGLPMVFNTLKEVMFVRQRMDEKLRALIEAAGYVNFGFAGGGFAYIMSNRPISNLDNMERMKIWIPEGDKTAYGAMKALGIVPVTLPITDVLTGLETNLLETVMGPAVGAIVLQWHTVVKHITDLPIAYIYGMLVIDGKAFNRISTADQLVVREVMETIYRGFDEEGAEKDREAFQALLDDGLELVPVEAGEAKEWARLAIASNRRIAGEGGFNAALLEEIDCYLAAYRSDSSDADCAK